MGLRVKSLKNHVMILYVCSIQYISTRRKHLFCMIIEKHWTTNEPIYHPIMNWPTRSNLSQHAERSATASRLNKDTAMSRDSVGQDHSFCLNGTCTSESYEPRANYLQTHRCGAETKDARLSPLFLAQELSSEPGNIHVNRQGVCVCVHTCVWLCMHTHPWCRKRIGACEFS